MRKLIIGAGLTALAVAIASAASAGETDTEKVKNPSKEQGLGILGGAAVGAAAGGPPGAIIGLAFGAWLGDRMTIQRVEIARLNGELTESGEQISALNRKLAEADRSIAQLTTDLKLSNERLAAARAGLPAMPPELQKTLRGEVMFRTNDTTLRPDAGSQLTSLAEVLSTTPGAVVQLDAYADARGTAEDNLKLSEARAAAVRDALLAGGLAPDRITVVSHGEEHAVASEGDADGYAFDRKVVITIGSADAQVAQAGATP